MMYTTGFPKIGLFVLLSLAAFCLRAESEVLFVEMVEQAKPNTEDLARSEKLIKEAKEIELKGDFNPPPFHKRREVQIKNSEQVYCNGCHLPVPHSKSLRTRAFMNMHTQYIACETCHFRPENVDLEYAWFEYETAQQTPNQAGRLHSGRDQKDQTQLLVREGKIKIAPFYQGQPALITRQHAFSQDLEQRMKKADLKEKSRLHAEIHKPLQTKGTECVECHAVDDDLLNLVELSDSPAQAKAIQRNTIADFFKHYKPEKPLAPGALPEPEQRIKITDLLN